MNKTLSLSLRAGLGALLALLAGPVFAQALSCDNVYGLRGSNGRFYTTAGDGAQTNGRSTSLTDMNAMGIGPGGTIVYLAHSTGAVHAYNAVTSTVDSVSAGASLVSGLSGFNAGAVNPANGWFYLAGAGSGGSAATQWHLYGYNPATPSAAPVQVGVITGTIGNNGDIAFDGLGNLYLVSGNASNSPANRIYRVGRVPTAAGNASLPATVLTTVTSSVMGNVGGIAFMANGEIMTSQGTSADGWIRRYNPLTGAELGSGFTNTGAITDLASCTSGSTVTLQKDLPQGRVASTDQFTLQLSGGGLGSAQTATTTGTDSGIQAEVVGPFPALDGTAFTINETAAGTTTLTDYTRSWECVIASNGDAPLASGSSFPGSFSLPTGTTSANVVCTITNELQAGSITIVKDAVPNHAQDFAFTGDLGNFSLDDDANGTLPRTRTFSDLEPGTYSVTESVLAGWTLTGLSCSGDTDEEGSVSVATRTADIDLDAGESITCTYTNAQTARLRVQKALPDGRVVATDQFRLRIADGTGVLVTADTTGTTTTPTQVADLDTAVANRQYTLSEVVATTTPATVLANYTTTYACTNARAGGQTPSGSASSFNVTPAANDDLVCTFTNRPKETIRLQKALPEGRIDAAHQFTLSIAGGPSGTVSTTTTGTGTTATGIATRGQAVVGTTYTLSEAASGFTPLNSYATTYACTNARAGGQTPSGTGSSFTLAVATGDNLTCTFTNTPTLPADLSITKTNNQAVYVPGQSVSYTLVAGNLGPNAVTGATVADTFPAAITGVTWTCTAAGGATCPASGSGNLNATVNLPVGGTATFTATGTVSAAATGSLANTATITAPANISDATPGNNSATDTDTLAARLTLIKTVTNDNGGTQLPTAWTLSATGPTNISGITGTAAVTNAVVSAGTYTLSESATPAHYVASLYSCVKNGGVAVLNNTLDLAAGDTAACTIHNNDSNEADLRIEQTVAPMTAVSGGRVEITLVVSNLGPAAAHGATVRNPAAEGLDCIAAELPPVTCSATGSANCPASLTASGLQVGAAIPQLPNGGAVTIGLTCTVTASGS